jgi:Zn-finger nucleic acid-binding protein
MNCPRCQAATLDERERDGVVVDACRTCRGLWLDRGELEKLIARAARDFDDVESHRGDTPHRGARYRDDDDDDGYRRDPRRKRRWYETLGNIFD